MQLLISIISDRISFVKIYHLKICSIFDIIGGIKMTNSLNKPVFTFLKMQELKPGGWLLKQLQLQAKGLSGNLDKFWPDIKNSQWLGGSAEGWERVPYWLDGFIPLAWLLDDKDMQQRASMYINYIIDHQSEDGWICPDNNTNKQTYDMWALFLLLKVLIVYEDATNDTRIQEVVRKALFALDKHIDGNTLFNWAQTRWFEALISIFWLYERSGEEWLLKLAVKLQSQGFDWISFFKHWPYKKPDEKGRWSQMSHVVNNAMMLKTGALQWRLSGLAHQLNSAEEMVKLLDEYHGMVTGVFTGDECLNGTSPVQGTELCSVVEYMYSSEWLLSITGNPMWGDRLEKIAFNALPATFSPDMWTHQYDQQVNQVQCSYQQTPIFGTNNGYSHTFGLEPNYGCCTANLSQGWPKFALSTFMKSQDGLVAAAYAPSSVSTSINSVPVKVVLETDYPFRDVLNFKITVDKSVNFTLYLRIPAWSEKASIKIDGTIASITEKGFYKLQRTWTGETNFSLAFEMKPELVRRPNDLVAITRGPLVYSIPIGENWVRINEELPFREFPHCDYEIYPTTPWNYGICLDEETSLDNLKVVEMPISDLPFSPKEAPIAITITGKKIDWNLENKSAAPIPQMDWISEKKEIINMLPYGCTNLRLTEFPIVK